MTILAEIMQARVKYQDNPRLLKIGKMMFDMYTQNGFPPDMFFDEYEKVEKLNKDEKIFIITEYQTLFLEHRRQSGIEEKNVGKVRKNNLEAITRFINTGEVGVY